MKKKLILLLIGLLFMVNINTVNAEDTVLNKTLNWGSLKIDGKGIYRIYKNKEGNTRKSINPILLKTLDDDYVFCVEMLVPLAADLSAETYTGVIKKDITTLIPKDNTITYNKIKYNTIDFIHLIAYYGNDLIKKAEGEEKNKYYAAAQRLIWSYLAKNNISPSAESDYDAVVGDVYFTTNTVHNASTEQGKQELNKYTLDYIKEIAYDNATYEKKILDEVVKYYNKPSILETTELKEYTEDEDGKKVVEIDTKTISDYTIVEKSECKLNDDKSKLICTDENEDNQIDISLTKGNGSATFMFVVNDSNKDKNQKILSSANEPKIDLSHSIKIIEKEIIVEPEEPNQQTGDTNILLIITIAMCTLISAIIIYIKKVKLIKNDTI